METLKKPPIGLCPKFIRDEQRIEEILEALDRAMVQPDAYVQGPDTMTVPIEWIRELQCLVRGATLRRTERATNGVHVVMIGAGGCGGSSAGQVPKEYVDRLSRMGERLSKDLKKYVKSRKG